MGGPAIRSYVGLAVIIVCGMYMYHKWSCEHETVNVEGYNMHPYTLEIQTTTTMYYIPDKMYSVVLFFWQ